MCYDEEKEEYTFACYLCDQDLTKSATDISAYELKCWWISEKDRYIKHCKDNNYDYENIDLI